MTDAILDTKRASERRLSSITPSVSTAYEAVQFTVPSDSMYQRVQFLINLPDDPVFGVGFHRERMQMQVFIADTKGHGTATAISRATLIRDTFTKGTTMIEGSTKIHVLETPQIGSSFITNDRVVVPVFINLVSEVYTD